MRSEAGTRRLATAILVPLLLLLGADRACGDGVAYVKTDTSGLRRLSENEQFAAIHHRDGVQRMVLAVNLPLRGRDQALWVFPVRGTPDKVKLEVIDDLPLLRGRDADQNKRDFVYFIFAMARLTQLWTLIELIALPAYQSYDAKSHAAVEKWGIRTETITASSTGALREFFRSRQIAANDQQFDMLKPYLVENYVLVAVWIKSQEELVKEFPDYGGGRPAGGRWPALFVEFATEKAFFPLRPSREESGRIVPVTLYIFGNVKPEPAVPYSANLTRKYFTATPGRYRVPPQLLAGWSGDELKYTRFELKVPARDFTHDLWFASDAAGGTYAHVIETLQQAGGWVWLATWFAVTALLSYLSAGLTGLLKYRNWRGCAKLGLWNLLTLLGLKYAIKRSRTEIAERIRQPVRWYDITFLSLFSVIFVLLSIALNILSLVPLW